MVVINIGMPRSGTLWRYNLIRALVIASGGEDALEIRKKFLLHPFVGGLNADMNTLKAKRLIPALAPSLLGKNYVLNTHARPQSFAKMLVKNGRIKAIYGFRDPRDCILSMMEYRERGLPRYSARFLELDSVTKSIRYMRLYMQIWEEWTSLDNTLVLRYEDMLDNFEDSADKIIQHLELPLDHTKIKEIRAGFLPRQRPKSGKRGHLEVGKAQRSRTEFSPEELEELNNAFAPYLEKMGYQI